MICAIPWPSTSHQRNLGGGNLGMPLVDGFTEIEMIDGLPAISSFVVYPESAKNPRYPANLVPTPAIKRESN
jgi:hypothetical protein